MFICSVQMSVLYKTHLDATIHWCNLPAHFWRTNYCALVKQTIWNASPLNRTCWGIQASSSLPAAFVLLLLVLSHICLLSGLKTHQRRGKRLCGAQGNCWWCFFVTISQVCVCRGSRAREMLLHRFHMICFPAVRTAVWQENVSRLLGLLSDNWCFQGFKANRSERKHQAGCVQITEAGAEIPPTDLSFWHWIDLKRMV